MADKQKKKTSSLPNLVEGTRRSMLGTSSDEHHRTSWKDTLLLIGLVIIGFIVYKLLT